MRRNTIKRVSIICFFWLFLFCFIYVRAKKSLSIYSYPEVSIPISKWDITQFSLGYYVNTLNDNEVWTYIQAEDMSQILFPCIIQFIGVVFSIGFLRDAYSYHIFVKVRIRSAKKYFTYYIKRIVFDGLIYGLLVFIAMIMVAASSSYLTTESYFNYQSGNYVLTLLLYSLMLVIMIVAIACWVFIGYCQKREVLYITVSFGFLIIINIIDRFSLSFNLILFDSVNHFLDGIVLWMMILIGVIMVMNQKAVYQEEYND